MTSMTITGTNTHELKEGDVILNYGRYLQLTNRKTYPPRPTDTDMQGECVTFGTVEVAKLENPELPEHWVTRPGGFTIQGNKLATWALIGAE